MKILTGIILMIAVFAYVTPMHAADAAAGKELYAKKCASCHGAAGEGKDSIAKMFKVEMRNLASREVQSQNDATLKKVMVEGTGKMKPVKDIDAKAGDDLVAYLRTLAKK